MKNLLLIVAVFLSSILYGQNDSTDVVLKREMWAYSEPIVSDNYIVLVEGIEVILIGKHESNFYKIIYNDSEYYVDGNTFYSGYEVKLTLREKIEENKTYTISRTIGIYEDVYFKKFKDIALLNDDIRIIKLENDESILISYKEIQGYIKSSDLKLAKPVPASNKMIPTYSTSPKSTYSPPNRKSTFRRYIRGPKGGCYYINSKGNKQYVDRSKCN